MLLGSRKCDCLDKLFEGKTVKMAGPWVFSREPLRIGSSPIPEEPPTVRTGREIEYNLMAVIQCMVAVLADEKRPWLPDPKIRKMILRGIIERAREKCRRARFRSAREAPNSS